MTITNENTENLFSGNGVTTVFPTNIFALEEEQITVYLREDGVDTLQTLTTHYTLSNLDTPAGVTITMLVAPTADQEVIVVRDTPRTQELDLTTTRAYNPEVLMDTLDRIVMMMQEVTDEIARAFKVKPGIGSPVEIEDATALAGLTSFTAIAETAAAVAQAAATTAQAAATAAAASAASVNADNLLTKAGNLAGLADVGAARTALGLGTAATAAATDFVARAAAQFNGSITETVFALSGTGPTLEPDNGTIQTHTLTGNTTYTDGFSNGQSMTLMINDGTAFTVTWPSVTWINTNGIAPTLATVGYTAVVLWKVGGVLYGSLIGDGT